MTREARNPPSREVALQWLELTGRSQSDCLDELWPPMGDKERAKASALLRQWVRRGRKAGTVKVAPPLAGPPPAVGGGADPSPATVEDEEEEPEDDDRLAWLRTQWKKLDGQVTKAIEEGNVRFLAQLSKRASEARREFDLELERQRRVVRLARTPAAISAELKRRQKAIDLRAEMQRRKLLEADP